MFKTLSTLIAGVNARSEDRITRVEEARNERLLADYIGGEDDKAA
mgnify:CR=1 FL=1